MIRSISHEIGVANYAMEFPEKGDHSSDYTRVRLLRSIRKNNPHLDISNGKKFVHTTPIPIIEYNYDHLNYLHKIPTVTL